MRKTEMRWADRSLEQKLPLIIGALLVVAIGVVTTAAWLEVKRSAERVAAVRLADVTSQFRDLFANSVSQIRQRIAPVASDPAVARFARSPTAPNRAAALAALRAVANSPEQVVATELRDAAGRVLLSTAPAETALAATPVGDVIPVTEPGDGARIGEFRLLRDTIVYPVAVPVAGANGQYVVRWRRMAGSRRTREQLAQLVGSDASIYLGNRRGNEWHDLERPVPRPPFASDTAQGPNVREVDGAAHLVALEPIPGAPWMVMVDFPAAQMREPANAFLRRMAVVAALALLAALAAAWVVSRRITKPLRELTDAAEGVAAGLYGQQVTLSRRDELGRLAESFSSMSAEVQRTRDGLEHLVQQRTRELEQAQESLVRRERLAMLGQLSSGVGHELRNPLGVMTNSVYFLRTVLRDAPPKVHEYLGIISQQIALSEKIVSDLLDFARQKPPQRKPVSLARITAEQVERLGTRDGVDVRVDIPGAVPEALADPVHVSQVVFNLLTNAVQAVTPAGKVTVRAWHDGGAGRVHYTVADDGPGVPPENADRIFEPLFTTKARGIGLGLAVSRTLARANGGDLVLAAPEGGRGAAFTFTLDAVSNPLSGLPQRTAAGEMA